MVPAPWGLWPTRRLYTDSPPRPTRSNHPVDTLVNSICMEYIVLNNDTDCIVDEMFSSKTC